MRICYTVLLIGINLLYCNSVSYSQNQNPQIQIEAGSISTSQLIQQIEALTDYFFAYNSDLVSDIPTLYFSKRELSLSDLLNEWDQYYPYDFVIDEASKKIQLSSAAKFRISGVVIDSFSGETMQDVHVFLSAENSTYTNEDGYFSIDVDLDGMEQVIISHVGYTVSYIPTSKLGGTSMIIPLSYRDSNLDITILDTPLKKDQFKLYYKHSQQDIEESVSISGTSDLLSYLKTMPSVSTGSEGQSGFNVRGGGIEQNLILLDGFPVYEASHLGGLSSIFLTDAIKNVEFYDSAFPARYDGRLSSVVDVRLKEGNRHQIARKLSLGIEGIQGQLEGPLSASTSINITGKKSLFSEIAKPLLQERLDLLEADLGYHDLYAKLTHWFSPSNRISLTGYTGGDRIAIQRNTVESTDSFQDFNKINWGNKVLGIQWNRAFEDRFFLTTSVGYSEYLFNSLGSYRINFIKDGLPEVRSFTILTESYLQDLSFNSTLDYYSDDCGKFKIGLNYTDHTNSPSILEDETFLNIDSTISVIDSVYNTEELSAFLEHELDLGSKFILFSGLRYNNYQTGNTSYNHLNPRLQLQYNRKFFSLSASYSRMSQFIHLLSNPGPGLPSDLWVPSTDRFSPQRSTNYNLSYRYDRENLSFGVSSYYKQFKSAIEYDNPSDVIYSFIIDTELYRVEVNNESWEERAIIGDGEAYGIEFDFDYALDKWKLNGAYALSRSTRSFAEVDDGEAFPFKFDRTHDIQFQVKYMLSRSQSIMLNFAYGTGNAYTLTDRRIRGPRGEDILDAAARNQYRVPSFHHLDIMYNIKHQWDEKTIQVNVGVYNIYNRLNPFYLYLQQSSAGDSVVKQISIYPILPQLNCSLSW